jgi:hypothetical protein
MVAVPLCGRSSRQGTDTLEKTQDASGIYSKALSANRLSRLNVLSPIQSVNPQAK